MKYEVEMTCIYNGIAVVEAESEDEAIKKVELSLDEAGLKGFPDTVSVPFGTFNFGEATADYADPIDEDTEVENTEVDESEIGALD